MRVVYSIITILIISTFALTGCKSSKVVSGEEQEMQNERATSLRDEIVGEWRLIAYDGGNDDISGREKEDFENYMEDLTVVFKLNLFADGTYFRNMPGFSDNGKWRLINGETGLELFSNQSEYNTTFDIKEYNNPRLTISVMKNGDQQIFFLERAEN